MPRNLPAKPLPVGDVGRYSLAALAAAFPPSSEDRYSLAALAAAFPPSSEDSDLPETAPTGSGTR